MDPEWFRSITEHLLTCTKLPTECDICRKVYGLRRPAAIVIERLKSVGYGKDMKESSYVDSLNRRSRVR